jgi:hypothetical protein
MSDAPARPLQPGHLFETENLKRHERSPPAPSGPRAPSESDDYQYRIKSSDEPHERVVKESELKRDL